MGYQTRCTSCYGQGKDWDGVACSKCGGTGNVKPYRRAISMGQGSSIGWHDMESSPKYRDDKCCVSCNKPLPGRKRTFCSGDCKSGYLWRVWKGAHWQKRAVAHRDGAACRGCGEVHESPIRPGGKPYPEYSMLQLDHRKPLHRDGDESPGNCQLLCEPCHKRKTARDRRSALTPSPLHQPKGK